VAQGGSKMQVSSRYTWLAFEFANEPFVYSALLQKRPDNVRRLRSNGSPGWLHMKSGRGEEQGEREEERVGEEKSECV